MPPRNALGATSGAQAALEAAADAGSHRQTPRPQIQGTYDPVAATARIQALRQLYDRSTRRLEGLYTRTHAAWAKLYAAWEAFVRLPIQAGSPEARLLQQAGVTLEQSQAAGTRTTPDAATPPGELSLQTTTGLETPLVAPRTAPLRKDLR